MIEKGDYGHAVFLESQRSCIVLYDDDHEDDEGIDWAVVYPAFMDPLRYRTVCYGQLTRVGMLWRPEMLRGDGEVVYVVALDPETMPNRVKVGYTKDLHQRMRRFRTVCPYATLLASWSVDGKEYEDVAHDTAERMEVRIGESEVFDCRNVWNTLFLIDDALRSRRQFNRERNSHAE